MRPDPAQFETSEVRYYRPRALLFSMLSLLWVFPSGGALWILFHDAAWMAGGVGAVSVEQWVGVAILAAHLNFITLALFLRRNEPLVPAPAPDLEGGADGGVLTEERNGE